MSQVSQSWAANKTLISLRLTIDQSLYSTSNIIKKQIVNDFNELKKHILSLVKENSSSVKKLENLKKLLATISDAPLQKINPDQLSNWIQELQKQLDEENHIRTVNLKIPSFQLNCNLNELYHIGELTTCSIKRQGI